MRRIVSLVLALAVASSAVFAQATSSGHTQIEIRFPNATQREAEVSIHFSAVPAGPLEVRMARSSPGRYAAHDFAKNIHAVRATDAAGAALTVERVAPNVWHVSGHRGDVRFMYTLFGDRADGTYAGIDQTRAHLNIPATFAYAPALASRRIAVTFVPPDTSWRVATQLEPTSDPRTFLAPNLQYFMDSPTHLGRLDIREWTVGTGATAQKVRLAVNHVGTAEQVTEYTERTKRVVNEMAAVFGSFPRFDYGTYTFIACYRSNCAGDGMEHRNSTSLTSSGSLASSSAGLLGTVSHEFFHAWNVERIRPATLEPFNFADANMSDALWFAEGFTNYYGPLVIARTGITTNTQYARQLSGAVNTLTTHPGRQFNGPIGMSKQAPYADAATSIDPHNRNNTFISYYTYGEAIGLALDLSLRARSPSASLDDVMQLMWQRFGPQTAALAPVRGYTVSDIQAAVADVARDSVFARDFFRRFIYGNELPDYPALLARAGFLVRQSAPTTAWMGDTRLSAFEGEVIVAGPTTMGSPMYIAGLSAGDRILRMDGKTIATSANVVGVLGAKKPGDVVQIEWMSRAGETRAAMTLRADPRVEVMRFEEANLTPSAEQLAFRARWLSSRQP